MGLKGGKTEKGTEIIWETFKPDSDHQQWKRSRPNKDGYFTLQSKATPNMFVHSVDEKITNGHKNGAPSSTPPPTNTAKSKLNLIFF